MVTHESGFLTNLKASAGGKSLPIAGAFFLLMLLINQCSTKEQSERLKELGVLQTISNFYWLDGIFVTRWGFEEVITRPRNFDSDVPHAAAFSVAELGIMLPPGDYSTFDENLDLARDNKDETPFWWSNHPTNNKKFKGEEINATGKTEAEARADLLIELLEKNIIKLSDVTIRMITY